MKWTREASESKSIWPYNIREDIIKVEIKGHLSNGDGVVYPIETKNWLSGSSGGLINNNAKLNLFDTDDNWADVELNLSVSLEEVSSFKNIVLQPGINVEIQFAIFIICPATRWRTVLTQPFGEGKADFTISLKRENVVGEVQIVPLIILAQETKTEVTQWAIHKTSKIGTGFPIYVYADSPEDKPGGGLEITWEDFPEQYQNALYQLDLSTIETPHLKLNLKYRPVLGPILDSKDRRVNNKTLFRDSMNSFIAQNVWLQLAEVAAKKVASVIDETTESEEEELASYTWILDKITRRIDWGQNEIVSVFNSEDIDLTELQRLQLAIQHYLSLARRQSDLVMETKTDSEEEGK